MRLPQSNGAPPAPQLETSAPRTSSHARRAPVRGEVLDAAGNRIGKVRGGAYFSGEVVEVMKKKFYGRNGHIAVSTNDAARAAHYLQKQGAQFNWDSAGYNEDGSLRVVYLAKEIGGFAVHILQK